MTDRTSGRAGAAAITAPLLGGAWRGDSRPLLTFRVEDLQGLTAQPLLDRNRMRAMRVALIF